VVVVAFTSVGKGEEDDDKIFFTEELLPTKPPGDVDFKQLSSFSFNISWTPLTLFEARGFPIYRAILVPVEPDINSRRRRQSNPNNKNIITNDNYAVFTDLRENTDYSVVVGVTTGNNSFIEGEPIYRTCC